MNANNVLIVGGLGYIGFHTAIKFLKCGYNVIITTRKKINDDYLILTKYNKCTIITVDYDSAFINGNFQKILINYNITIIIHCAGEKSMINSWIEEKQFIEKNVNFTKNLLNVLTPKIKNFIFLSTSMVYGDNIKGVFKENDLTVYKNPYAKSKIEQENLLKNDIKGLNIVILRCFNPIGMSEEYLKKSLIKNDTIIPTILNCIKENKPFNIYGNNFNTKDGTTIRDYVDINDVVDCIYKSYQNIQTKSNTYNIWNIGSGKGYSIKELIEILEKITQESIKINYLEARKGESPILIANMEKTKKDLDFSSLIPLSETLKNVVKLFLK